jgi:hypothetical protein
MICYQHTTLQPLSNSVCCFAAVALFELERTAQRNIYEQEEAGKKNIVAKTASQLMSNKETFVIYYTLRGALCVLPCIYCDSVSAAAIAR